MFVSGIDWSDLKELYEQQKLSAYEVASLKGCTEAAVRKALARQGIQIRSRKEAARRGADHRQYKNGLDANGYARTQQGSAVVKVHRAVCESILGRPLSSLETVHHCNGIKHDNRPENLWVFPSGSDHARYHKTGAIHPGTIFLKDSINTDKEEL